MQPPRRQARLRLIATAALAAAGSSASLGFAGALQAADAAADEVLIGTFQIGRKTARPVEQTLPPTADGIVKVGARETAGAGALYELATRELSAGRRDDAQRTFEQIVARFPSDPMAAEARRQLALIYLDDLEAAAARRTAQQPAAPDVVAAAPPADPWRVEVSPVRTALESFAVDAGDRIFFSSGSAELGGRGRLVAEAQAAWLKSRPGVVVVVEGHADEPGTDADNQRLSESRAEAVRARLIAAGVAPERVTIAALGRQQRVSECADSDCAARNRRAVTVVQYAQERPNAGANTTSSPQGALIDPRSAGATGANQVRAPR